MKEVLIRRTVMVLLVVAALGAAEAQPGMMGPWYGHGWSQGQMNGPGMWPGRGGAPYGPGMGYGMGPGMGGPGMGGPGMGYGFGGGGMMGGGMIMSAGTCPLPPNASPLPTAAIQSQLQSVLSRYPAGAKIDDIMPFANNVYAQVVDAQGRGLAELIVDRYSGSVTPEPGPNMMWNLAGTMSGRGGYGAAGGAMNGNGGGSMMPGSQPGASPRYDVQQAQDLANTFLAKYSPGAKVLQAQTFDGYYTFDYGSGGIQGMLSVNAFTGAVWPHAWHGAYLGNGQ